MKSKILGMLLIAALLLQGCADRGNRGTQRGTQDGNIVIGVSWPFATRNDGFNEGIDMALDEIADAGGLLGGRKLELRKEDDESSVTGAMSIAQKFAASAEVSAVIGNRGSSLSIPSSSIYEDAGIVMLSPGSTAPKLTEQGYTRIFRMIPSDIQIGERMAQYAALRNYKRIAILYADDDYGRGLANVFEDRAKLYKLSTIDRRSGYTDTQDLKRMVQGWGTLNCDAIFIADVMPAGLQTILDLRSIGVKLPILGGDGLDSTQLLQLTNGEAEGTVVASIFNPKDERKEVQEFVRRYQQRYDTEPTKWSAQGYDAVMLLAQAIETAGSAAPDDIAKALRAMKWTGGTGPHTFNEQGDVQQKPVVLKQVRGGQFDYLE